MGKLRNVYLNISAGHKKVCLGAVTVSGKTDDTPLRSILPT